MGVSNFLGSHKVNTAVGRKSSPPTRLHPWPSRPPLRRSLPPSFRHLTSHSYTVRRFGESF